MDKRKMEILKAIVHSYILSPVPVGSRRISKEYDLGVSSATIRNEMSDLEELGYLNKPHTSAGRVPSDKAYRFYVDKYLQESLQEKLKDSSDQVLEVDPMLGTDEFYEQVADYLADTTKNLAYVLAPKKRDKGISYLDLFLLDEHLIYMIIVGDQGIVERSVIRREEPIDAEELAFITERLNESLLGIDFQEISGLKLKLSGEMVQYEDLILRVVEVAANIAMKVQDVDIYSSGLTNILNYEEFHDIEHAKELMSFMEDKDNLIAVATEQPRNKGVSISIGSENEEEILKDNSIISTDFYLDKNTRGRVGLIGSVRMPYLELASQIISISKALSYKLGKF